MKRLVLLLLPLLAACGTPQENCIARVTRDLRVVESLISETETNLRRGYAMEEYTTYHPEWRECGPPIRKPRPGKPDAIVPQMCLKQVPVTRERPKAIDLQAEAAKLQQLRIKRDQLARDAAPAIAQCRAQYPE